MLSIISFLITSAMAVTVSLMPSEIYTPQGFDTNDTNIQIGFDSMYPDTCYQYLPNQAEVSEDEKIIRIDNLSDHKQDQICAKVIRYFDDIVNLGPIQTEGLYDIQFLRANGNYQSVGSIQVYTPEDPESNDNRLYAPLSDVIILDAVNGNAKKAKLVATSPYSCLKFEKIEVNLQKNTIVVLPSVNKPDCAAGDKVYKISEEIPLEGLKGRYMLHIRAMNSRAINKFIEL